jgi:c-di-GMP-binding flagellar brake protein YcgR
MSKEEDDEKYRIHSQAGILSILRAMTQSNCLATCHFGPGENRILTTIIEVDGENDEMVLDYGPDETVNEKALKAGAIDVLAYLEKVRIEFTCEGFEKIEYEGRDAFLAPIPETLLRFQRREHYRINAPAVPAVKCVVPLAGAPRAAAQPASAEVTVSDIGGGGMAVVDMESKAGFQLGALYRDCLVTLPELGIVKVNLQVQHVSEIAAGKGQRARCAYVSVPENTLSLIQRYINKLELERRRKQ